MSESDVGDAGASAPALVEEVARVEIVVAVARNGVIGSHGQLPWRLSADLRRFKRLTMGHVLVVGRKTWESIGRPLPGRQLLVVTRDRSSVESGAGREVLESLDDLNEVAQRSASTRGLEPAPIFCIGGAEIYRQLLPRARRMHWTWVEAEVPGTDFFPEVAWDRWRLSSEEPVPADGKNEYSTTYCVYDRLEH